MRNVVFGCALLGVTALSSAATAAVISFGTPSPASGAVVAKPKRSRIAKSHARAATFASLHVHVHVSRVRRVEPHRDRARVHAVVGARRIGASPSLYEKTTAITILRAQGCAAGKAQTSGLVVLDFGELSFRSDRGGYGTVTFANRFAPNRSITWAMKSYAHGYSKCLPRRSKAHITLARGTSNYGADTPSTYTAGRLWAGATVAVANYLRRHHLDHVTSAAADDVEPAWDRGFARTYGFFRGYAHADHGYLLYNYGSLDGGVGAIWKLRQAYYVAGGMHEARAVPEIYNRAMAQEWGELARLSYARYGTPIKLAGLMTQHWTSCSRCGFTAPRARHELARALAKTSHISARTLASVTNIEVAAP